MESLYNKESESLCSVIPANDLLLSTSESLLEIFCNYEYPGILFIFFSSSFLLLFSKFYLIVCSDEIKLRDNITLAGSDPGIMLPILCLLKGLFPTAALLDDSIEFAFIEMLSLLFFTLSISFKC